MPKKHTTTEPVAPEFDLTRATAVTPYRHEETARTVAYHMPAGENTALFSATRKFIALVEGTAPLPAAPEAAPESTEA